MRVGSLVCSLVRVLGLVDPIEALTEAFSVLESLGFVGSMMLKFSRLGAISLRGFSVVP